MEISTTVMFYFFRYPRYKKYLTKVCDKIHSFCTEKENLVVILYSLGDDKFKQIIWQEEWNNHYMLIHFTPKCKLCFLIIFFEVTV